VALTSGCRLRVGEPAKSQHQAVPEPTADELALGRADGRAGQLATLYAQAAQLRPDLDAPLRQLAADHTAHGQALQALLVSSTPTGMSSASATASPTSPTSPALTATTVLSALGQAERSSTSAALADLAALSPAAARLLASVAACSSAHLTVLARLPARPRTTKPTGTPTKQGG
jgi:hypothetical protein